MLHTNLGTEGYKSPEIINDMPYSGKDADLFASAVVLFLMVMG